MKALLLIDIQNQAQDEWHKEQINSKFVQNVKELINYADSNGISVVHIVTEYTEDNMPAINKQRGFKFFMKGTYEAEEIKEIKETFKKNHYRIVKQHYDSFWNTNLQDLLKELNVDEIIISGVYTHWCVLSTVFSAMSRNLNITVVTDCVGSRYPELDQLIFKNIFDRKTPALRVMRLEEVSVSE